MKKFKHNQLLKEFIHLYHQNFFKLYSEENLVRLFCNDKIPKEKFDTFKNYFIQSIYPVQQDREKLDAAFGILRKFIFSPRLIILIIKQLSLGLLKSKIGIINLLKIATQTLNYYNYIIKFEKKLTKNYYEVSLSNIKLIDREKFRTTLQRFELSTLKENLNQTLKFLNILNSRYLVKNLIIILQNTLHVVIKEKTCEKKEIEGLKLVIKMTQDGYILAEKFTQEEMKELLKIIEKVETDFIVNEIAS